MSINNYLINIVCVCRCDWIEWRGSTIGEIVLCGFQEDDLPEFGKVLDILVVKNEAFLCVSRYTTKGTDAHYHSYVISSSHGRKLIHVNECNEYIGSLHPLKSHSLKATPGIEYIVTKCLVIKT